MTASVHGAVRPSDAIPPRRLLTERSFEEALAELLLARDSVEQITVRVGGEEIVEASVLARRRQTSPVDVVPGYSGGAEHPLQVGTLASELGAEDLVPGGQQVPGTSQRSGAQRADDLPARLLQVERLAGSHPFVEEHALLHGSEGIEILQARGSVAELFEVPG